MVKDCAPSVVDPCAGFRLGAAQIVLPVSMANITGKQAPGEAARVFTQGFLPYASGPTVDVHVVTTEGLYANDAGLTAYEWRRLLDKSLHFRAAFDRNIDGAARDNPLILPHAYQHHAWDSLLLATGKSFTQARGLLRDAYNASPEFRQCVDEDIRGQGRTPHADKVAFILEEHALSYLVLTGKLQLPRRLTPPDSLDAVIVAYPGPPMKSQVAAYHILDGVRPFAAVGQMLYADVSSQPFRLYDMRQSTMPGHGLA